MIEWEASYKELNEAQLNGDILKIAGAEFTRDEAMRIYQNNLFIVNGRGVWQVLYSTAQRTYYGQKHYTPKRLDEARALPRYGCGGSK